MERSYRGIGMNNEILDETFQTRTEGVIRCKRKLGRITKSYYREAP